MTTGAVLFLVIPAVCVGLISLAVERRLSRRRRTFERSRPRISETETYAEWLERMIAWAGSSRSMAWRAYVLGLILGMHESGRIDDEEHLRLSASVVEWSVEFEGLGPVTWLRRRRAVRRLQARPETGAKPV